MIFHADKVISQHISESNLRSYLVGFDLNDKGMSEYRWGPLVNLLQDVIPEFAFGFHEGKVVPQEEMVHRLCEAAKSIYRIDVFREVADLTAIEDDDPRKKYLSRGEFGELVLHLLLRSFHETVPLLSKIHFKDAYGSTVHGFDAVHVQPSTKTLWLGESKLYKDGKRGISALIDDLKDHINQDYLNSEFSIISKKLKIDNAVEDRDHWIDLMHHHTKLSDILNDITIPVLCTYSSDNFNKYDDEKAEEFIKDYENEIRKLEKHFNDKNDHPLKTSINVILLLFPVPSKDQLVSRLHAKLQHLQRIDE